MKSPSHLFGPKRNRCPAKLLPFLAHLLNVALSYFSARALPPFAALRHQLKGSGQIRAQRGIETGLE